MGYKISRYWNRLILYIMRICLSVIWDYTKHNKWIIEDIRDELEDLEILT